MRSLKVVVLKDLAGGTRSYEVLKAMDAIAGPFKVQLLHPRHPVRIGVRYLHL